MTHRHSTRVCDRNFNGFMKLFLLNKKVVALFVCLIGILYLDLKDVYIFAYYNLTLNLVGDREVEVMS